MDKTLAEVEAEFQAERIQRENAPEGYSKNGKKIGRPPNPIDWRAFESLCKIHCTNSEIASVLKISQSRLVERAEQEYEMPFQEIYKRYSENGKASLRRSQLKQAHKNATMAIWMGKQLLGQREPERQNQDEAQAHHFVQALGLIAKGAIPLDIDAKLKRLEELEKLHADRAEVQEGRSGDENVPDVQEGLSS